MSGACIYLKGFYMRNKNIIMLLMSSLILSGCGPESENKESQQQQPSTPTDQQVLAAQQAAIKEAEQRSVADKATADAKAKALAQQEAQQYSDKQALQGAYRRLQNINMQPEKKQRPKSQIQEPLATSSSMIIRLSR